MKRAYLVWGEDEAKRYVKERWPFITKVSGGITTIKLFGFI